jgi:glutamyl-tRNA reductase
MTIEVKVSSTSIPVFSLPIVNARISYRKVPIHILERFMFADMEAAHEAFINAGFGECVIVQTCNRVEVYAASSEHEGYDLLQAWSAFAGLSAKDFAEAEVESGRSAVGHLMKLASGLDSLVVGEDQILGQVKRAFMFSATRKYTGPTLNAIFDRAIKVGTKVRLSTGINKGNVSIASVAMSVAQEYFDDIASNKIMLVGTGEAATLVAKILKNQSIPFIITSRTPERAKWFATTIAGKPVPFDDAVDTLSEIDIVFVATTAPYLLLPFDRVAKVLERRSKKSLIIFDLSNPRTVDDRVTTIPGVKLINLDQIGELANKNLRSRMKEYNTAEKMIEEELKSVDLTISRLRAEPLVNSVFKQADRVRRAELTKAIAALGNGRLSSSETLILEQLSHAIVEGILSPPMNNLRTEMSTGDGEELLRVIGRLFKYEREDRIG